VGLLGGGLIRYDPDNKTSMHFGAIYENDKLISSKDTSKRHLSQASHSRPISSKEGLFWVIDNRGFYYLNYNKTFIPFYSIGDKGANSFYYNAKDNILWVATDKGLLRQDLTAKRKNYLSMTLKIVIPLLLLVSVNACRCKWQSVAGYKRRLDKFDPTTGKFVHYIT
jgi:ligand-binding sensor domain-containing protein